MPIRTRCSLIAWIGVSLSIFTVFPSRSDAAASASQWVVLVNGDSLDSRTIANHYVTSRDVPSRNIIVLRNIPETDQITVDQFRELILIPALKEIETRGIANHIQGIAYSADFPTAIDLQSDLGNLPDRSPYLTPVGSINGLTYLFRLVLAKNPGYIGFESNLYAARPSARLLTPIFTERDQPERLKKLIEDSNHKEAAILLDEINLKINSSIAFPMLYLSAREWAFAGESVTAIKRLEQAIRAGWCYRKLTQEDRAFESLRDNKDFQRITKRAEDKPFLYDDARAFDARTFYASNGLGSRDDKQGVSYMLSMVLAVTKDLGTSRSEAIQQLEASSQADWTYPSGSFYFTKTQDVRTTTREPNFAMAIQELRNRGFEATVVEQPLPPSNKKCLGVMIGTPDFSWGQSQASLVPGAIADNLTSLGGAMTTSAQTKLSEFLRFGAAASSGAVTEPYSIQNKFPHPMIHVHYVDGLTAAEAFYSSVTCPYQLLIVGDPLCNPFGRPPRFDLDVSSKEVKSNETIKLGMKPILNERTTEPEQLQLMVDGLARGQSGFQPNINMKFDPNNQGAYELRLVSIHESRVSPRYEKSVWVTAGDSSNALHLSGPEEWKRLEEKPLIVRVSRPKSAKAVRILHDWEVVATLEPGSDTVELSHRQLGYGPARLQAEVDIGSTKVKSLPITCRLIP
jgi:hypothetical protein